MAKQPQQSSQKVMGVLLGEVDEDVLNRSLLVHNLEVEGSLSERAKRMAQWFKKNTPKTEIADCTTCGGDSDIRLERCPFCGDGDVEGDEPPLEERPAAAVVPAPSAPVSKFTEKDLDKSVQRINKLKVAAARGIYELGLAIRENYEDELWKLRRDDEGNVAYRNWKQFCAGELGMSHTHAYKLMDIAAAFTQKDIDAIGSSKLGLVLQVPEPYRSKLLDQAKDGASKADLSDELKKLKSKDGEKEKAPPRITMALGVGRVDLPLLKMNSEDKPAKRMTDKPWAEELLSNDVTVRYVVTQNSKGEMILVVERHRTPANKREDADE